MPENETDQELQAIQTIVSAMNPLDTEARSRVIDYVFKRLGLSVADAKISQSALAITPPKINIIGPSNEPASLVKDIRTLKEQKAPRSSIEMAALVAYYLAGLAPESERRETIGAVEIRKYFTQADFDTPTNPSLTLFQGKNAGYFDMVKRGQYKLNPVGQNLVAHGLPPVTGEQSGLYSFGSSKPRGANSTKTSNKVKRRKYLRKK